MSDDEVCPVCLSRNLIKYTKWKKIYKKCPDARCHYRILVGWVR